VRTGAVNVLGPWTGRFTGVTLLDMKEYLAPRLTKLARELYDARMAFFCRGEDEDDKKVSS